MTYINKNYKSVISSKLNHDKMKIILSNLSEANTLVSDKVFAAYRVYIPATHVEVEGAINYSDIHDLQSISELKQFGEGRFNNTLLDPVEIVSVYRLQKRESNDPSTSASASAVQLTNTVKVTFSGRLLPNYIVIENLRIRVRPFTQKAMFCNICQQFNHTNKFCKRMPKCARCQGQHLSSDCKNPHVDRSVCPYCNSRHEAGINNCPHFAEVNESYRQRQMNRLQARYFNAVTTSATAKSAALREQEFPDLSNPFNLLQNEENETIPETTSSKTPMKAVQQRLFPNPWSKVNPANQMQKAAKRKLEIRSSKSSSTTSYAAQARKQSTAAATSIPGFQSTNQSSHHEAIKQVIMKKVRSSNVPSEWADIAEAILPIILDAILGNISNLLNAVLPALLDKRS